MIILIILSVFTSIPGSPGFAADEKGAATEAPAAAAENTASAEAQSALAAGIEEQAVLGIVGGLVILTTVAIASDTEDSPTAHFHGHGH